MNGKKTLWMCVANSALLAFIAISSFAAAPPAALSPGSLNFGMQIAGTTSAAQVVTLTNKQSTALTITNIAASGDFAETNTCDGSLGAGASCTISVTFTPTATGPRAGTLTVTDSASNSPQMASLAGTGGAPLTFSATSLAFGPQVVGTTSLPKALTLTNNLPTTLIVSSIGTTAEFAETNTCGGSVGAKSSCTISVTFTPTATGTRTGALTITDSAVTSPQVISLSGTGSVVGLASISVTPSNPSIPLGLGQQFTATGTFKNGTTSNLTTAVAWTSSAVGIATINAAGLARSVAQGMTTITATSGTVMGSTILTVAPPALVSIAVTPANPSIQAGTTQQFTATGSYTDSSMQNLTNSATWSSSATSAATISSTGLATGVAPGQTTIAAAVGAVAGSTLLTVTPGTGSFAPTGSLSTGRAQHTATLLNNGMVLVAGGSGPAGSSAELYNPATGTFTPTGSLSTGRDFHTATLLNNGMVLIAGGFGPSFACQFPPCFSALAGAELYNPATGTFTPTGSMNTTREFHTATLLNNGMVLVAGGAGFSLLASAELYNPVTGTFTLTGSLSIARAQHTSTLLSSGLVLMAGGCCSLAGAELYDPATGTFAPTGSLNTARYNHTATLLNNGMVLVAGGFGSSGFSLANAELFQPRVLTPAGLVSIAVTPAAPTLSPGGTQRFIATGTFSDSTIEQLASVTWSSSDATVAQISNDATNHGVGLAVAAGTAIITASAGAVSGSTTLTVRVTTFVSTGSLNTGRALHTATVLNNGMVLMAGGDGATFNLASAELYDRASGMFTLTGSLNIGRSYHTATLLNNGKVLIAGGFGSTDTLLSDAELYDPASGMFTPTGSLNFAREYHTSTLLNNGMVLIAGGLGLSGYLTSAELYDPATGIFTPTGSLNTARGAHTATLLNNGMVLMAGGVTSSFSCPPCSSVLSSAELYDPATGTFTSTGSLITARQNHTATLLNNGMVLMAGGAVFLPPTPTFLTSAELYNPTTGTFTPTGNLNIGRVYHTATLLNNGMVLVAGGSGSSTVLNSAELYNPAFGTFAPANSLNMARAEHTATLLSNGAVLIAGGQNFSGVFFASAELYGP